MIQKAIKNQPECTIEWNNITLEEWCNRISQVKRLNLLQSHNYGCAMAKLNNQRIRRGIIKKNDQEIGLVQILEAGILKNVIHAVLLDRGPVWFDGYGSYDDCEAFLQVFSSEFPKRFGRRIRFIPEFENTDQTRSLLRQNGYQAVSKEGYQTLWLDLRSSLDDLRTGLKKKWRNQLHQAERKGSQIVWSDEGKYFAWLMKHYAMDKAQKQYDGPSVKTMVALASEFSRGQNMLIGTALLDDAPIAAILIFLHGNAATYQIGYSSDAGRDARSHYMLLWSALAQLKERNVKDFDLGGMNGQGAEGIKNFKKGMGGTIHETLGLYR